MSNGWQSQTGSTPSNRRLQIVGAIFAFVVVAIAVTLLLVFHNSGTGSTSAKQAAQKSVVTSTTAGPTTTTATSGISPGESLTPQVQQRMSAVAVNFLKAWARNDVPQPQWSNDLKPYTDPSLQQGFAYTDVNTQTITAVTGPPILVSGTSEQSLFRINTNGGFIRVTVGTENGDQYLVTYFEPEQDPRQTSQLGTGSAPA